MGSDPVGFVWEGRGFESPKIHVERSWVRISSDSRGNVVGSNRLRFTWRGRGFGSHQNHISSVNLDRLLPRFWGALGPAGTLRLHSTVRVLLRRAA